MNATYKRALKTLSIITVTLALLVVVILIDLAQQSKPATSVGLLGDKLQPCPTTANCVLSEESTQTEHFIPALELMMPRDTTPATLIESTMVVITSMGGVIKTHQDNYLLATFSSAIFGFIDDLEVRLISNHPNRQSFTLHFRSASRVGKSDFGANRKRVELLKSLLLKRKKP
ncbi:MAG: hypothetical protein OFPII_34520 [Osedax symbiont Rs1]|nr:MAG: hypothetical protein OFPII_34520 [Osedax symbiont Rs1]